MPTALKHHFELELADVAKRAARYALENCGAKPGGLATSAQMAMLGPLASQYMMPFIQRHARRS